MRSASVITSGQGMANYPDGEAQAVKADYTAMADPADPAGSAIASLAFLIWRKAAIYYPAIVRLLCPADPVSDRIAWSRSTDYFMRIICG